MITTQRKQGQPQSVDFSFQEENFGGHHSFQTSVSETLRLPEKCPLPGKSWNHLQRFFSFFRFEASHLWIAEKAFDWKNASKKGTGIFFK